MRNGRIARHDTGSRVTDGTSKFLSQVIWLAGSGPFRRDHGKADASAGTGKLR